MQATGQKRQKESTSEDEGPATRKVMRQSSPIAGTSGTQRARFVESSSSTSNTNNTGSEANTDDDEAEEVSFLLDVSSYYSISCTLK